jgi:hypothetical protein
MAPLDAERFVATAMETTGLSDLGSDSWRDGFTRLVDALEHEAALNDLGRVVVEGEITTYAVSRLGIMAEHAAHPENRTVPVVPPIVIVGQGRTGTTILHDLLAQDPETRVPLTWEVDRPCPPPEAATFATDPRIEEVDAQLAATDLVLPGFRAMHPMGARLAQECVRITALEYRSMIFPTQYHVPSYGQWLLYEADMTLAYDWHRLFLQHLQSRNPATRWVLKSPGHIWCLDALLASYPDALLVQTHRDPLRIIASLGSLVCRLRQLASDTPTIPQAAAEYAEYVVAGLDRSVDARLNGTVATDRVVDVQFRDFMADPFTTIRTIYERLGLELSPDAEARMRAFLAAHPQGVDGVHRYTWADTELDAPEWRERCTKYQEHFGVASEPLP